MPGTLLDALMDDLNTPKAITALHELRQRAAHRRESRAAALNFLGVLPVRCCQHRAEAWTNGDTAAVGSDDAQIDAFIDARNAARTAKDFKEADRIRDELEAMGIVLKDAKDPTPAS